MLDVLIAGAGPAGSIAALVLARAGVRVLLVDRDVFPRDKLCGDTLNPGALALLASLELRGGPLDGARPLAGMRVTGPVADVRATYGDGMAGLALRRRDLDLWLLEAAIRAGAKFESSLVARAPLLAGGGAAPSVRGLVLAGRGTRSRVSRVPARMVVAADGLRSNLGRQLGLSRTPRRTRRWAFGAYARGVAGVGDLGEMHVRGGAYVGIAPVGADIVNVCAVTTPRPGAGRPMDVIRQAIASASLSPRFERAAFVGEPAVLGPLAVDVAAAGIEGLLLAGDAAGFVDPMTGDGLPLAMRGAVLAAQEAIHALDTSDLAGAPARLGEARRRALGPKVRFNRLVRRVSSSPAAVLAAGCCALVAPGLLARAIKYAGT